jgi:FkbM family methyltransferase
MVLRGIDAALRWGLRLLPPRPWAEAVSLWWGYQFRPGPAIVPLRCGAKIRVTSVDHLQLLIYYLGVFEPSSVSVLRNCLRPGTTVIDIGANIGFYTLECAVAVGPTGRVVSIEAAPEHARAVRDNLQLNVIGNVTVLEVALGESAREAVLTRPDGANLGMFTLGAVSGRQEYRVQVRTLDEMLEKEGVTHVDFIKIDIEGSELGALRGASRLIERSRPTILIELNDAALRSCGSSPHAVKRLLQSAGYRGWVITSRGLEPLADIDASHHCDECLFIHRDNRSLMQKLGAPGI